jgi:hypothetical protein
MTWFDWISRVRLYIALAAIGVFIAELVVFGTEWVRSRRRGLRSVAAVADSLSDLRLRVSILETLAAIRQDRRDDAAHNVDANESGAGQSVGKR